MTTTNDLKLPAERVVRKATDNQMTDVARVLGSAFTHDPVINWFTGRRYLGEQMFAMEAQVLYRHHGHVYINANQTGAAMWLPPNVSPRVGLHWRVLQALWQLLMSAGIKGMSRGQQMEQVMSAQHPEEPHYYLHAIGAHLEHQGKGIGSALLKTGLRDVDAAHLPAYLESSNVRNNALYQRFGFEIIGEHTFAPDGPTVWFMWRPAQ